MYFPYFSRFGGFHILPLLFEVWRFPYASLTFRGLEVSIYFPYFSRFGGFHMLPLLFEVWRFPYISLTFGNTFGLLELLVEINGKISSFFFSVSPLSCS